MTFDFLAEACGLARRDAATIFRVPPETIDSWAAERERAPDAVLTALATLDDQIEAAAEQTLARLDAVPVDERPDAIELGLATTDEDARSLGLPCVGAHLALLGRIMARGTARGHHLLIVPRGSTPSSRAAIGGALCLTTKASTQ